jgi:type IV pilus assembly protein PilM
MEDWNENHPTGGEQTAPPDAPSPAAFEPPAPPEPWAQPPTVPPAAAEQVDAAAVETTLHATPAPGAEWTASPWPAAAPAAAEPPAYAQPVAPAVETPAPAAPPEQPAASQEKTSFLKRDLRLGRKSAKSGEKSDDAPVKKPLLKRDLSLRGSSRSPKESAPKRNGGPGKTTKHKKLVGLTVGAAGLAAAEVVNNGHSELVKLAQRPLERGIVVGGEVRDTESLANELKAFFREHKLPQRGVRLGIASNRIGVRIIDIDGVEGKQLENAVRFRGQEALPIPIDQAVLDYRILDERTEDGVVKRRILLVVAYREPVDRYVAACQAAGIRLTGIDLEAFGLLRALGVSQPAPGAPEAATVVVALGHDRSILAVSAHGICEFTRVFDWGGFALDVAVSRELELAPTAAEPTRRTLGVSGALVPGGLNPERATAARAAVQRQLQAFARELVSSLQFYQDQPNSLGFGEIVLAGGLAQTAGIDRELERLIGVPVRVGNPLDLVKHGKRIADHDALPALAGAIGLGMEV